MCERERMRETKERLKNNKQSNKEQHLGTQKVVIKERDTGLNKHFS